MHFYAINFKNIIKFINNDSQLKLVFYIKKQDKLVDKIINILELDNGNSIILYNLDNDKTIQYNIKY
jgi:hypothetical protein